MTDSKADPTVDALIDHAAGHETRLKRLETQMLLLVLALGALAVSVALLKLQVHAT